MQGDADMSFISGSGATRTLTDAPDVSFADVRGAFKSFAIVVTAVMLAACAQSSIVTDQSALAPSRQA